MARLQKKNAGGSHHRFGQNIPAFPARLVLTVSFVLSLGIGVLAPICDNAPLARCADLSVERPGPHDFAVRAGPRSSGAAVTSIAAHLYVS
ncbi:hypothetical protein [Bradyrhizobium sp. ORS 285]|uniref:hypothetical protein n=1 Tax=Bradyrhizobium sp. ORS 285 TaxID=115808 RepID=UPI0005529D47|nr:hypothetical protein [Bradyrhizobium sp. ORS 285]